SYMLDAYCAASFCHGELLCLYSFPTRRSSDLASLNIHAWVAYSLGQRTGRLLNDDGTPGDEVRLNPWALIFGPSITIGSLAAFLDRKSTRLNSSHVKSSYAVFCMKKKKLSKRA